jgi:hypothetical protein
MVSTPQGALNAFDYEADTEGQQPEQAQSPLAQLAANEPVPFDIDRAKRGILGIESGGNYEALGPLTRNGDRAYGKYQVMGANIPQWTEAALGVRMTPEAFLKDKDAQEKVFEHRFGQYVNKYGNVADAASAWFSGKPIAEAGNRSDVLGTTVPAYVSKFLASYNSEGAGQPRGSVADRQEATTATAAAPSAQPKSNLDNLIKMLNAAEPKQQQGGASLLQQVMRQNAQAHQAARSKSLAQVAEFDKELVDKLAKQVQGYATGGQVTDNISKIYQDVLGRDPDAEGLAYWQQQADKGTSLDDIRKSFEASPEKQIQSYYSDILGRAPDTEGLNYWQNRAAQGMNLGDIKSTFQNVAAQEFDPILEKQYAAANTGTATDASNAPQWKTWWGYNPNQKDYDAMLRAGLGEAPAGSADQYRAIYEALGNRAALGSPYGSKGDIASVITPSQVQGAFNLSGIKSLLNTDAGQAAKQALDDYLAQGQNKVLTTQTDWRGFQNNQPSSGSYAGKLVPGDTSGLSSFNTFYNPIGNEKLAQQLADMQRRNNAIYGADPFVDVKDKPTDVVSNDNFVSNVPTGGYNPFDTTDFSSSYTSQTSSTDSYDPWKTTNDLNAYYNNFNSNSLTPPTWSTGTFNPGYSSLDYLGPMIGSFDFSPTWSSFKDGGQFKAMFDEDTPEMQDRAKELARSAYTNKLPKDQRKEWESLAAKYNLPLSLGEFNTYEDQYSDALSKWQRGLNPNERAQYHSLGGLVAKYAKGGEFKEVADEDVNPYKDQVLSAPEPMTIGELLGQNMRRSHETNIREFPTDFQNLAVVQGLKELPHQLLEAIKFPGMALKNELVTGIDPHTGEVTGVTPSGMGPTDAAMIGAGLVSAGTLPDIMAGKVTPNILRAGSPSERAVELFKAPRTDLGFYSHGAETAANLPQAKGTPEQFRAMLEKYGVKPAELEGFNEAFAGRPSVTREELAQHFNERMPQVEERVLGKNVLREQKVRSYETELENKYNLSPFSDLIESGALSPEERTNLVNLYNEYSESYGSRQPTKFEKYTLPGGENYREVRLKLPEGYNASKESLADLSAAKEKAASARNAYNSALVDVLDGKSNISHDALDALSREESIANARVRDLENLAKGPVFQSQHWRDAPNTVAHIRMSDRVGPNGEKLLHVEELQSDWAQKGRKKGFIGDKYPEKPTGNWQVIQQHPTHGEVPWTMQTEAEANDWYRQLSELGHPASEPRPEMIPSGVNEFGVPRAPYVTNTQGWTDLALKRVMKEAAEGGYDGVVFTPGAEQAKRYDLSKHIDELHWHNGNLVAYDKDGNMVIQQTGMRKEDLPDVVGKEVADKLLSQEPNASGENRGWRSLEGQDLSIGGEGMKGYYDKIVPTQLQKLVKPLDKNVKLGTMKTKSLPEMIHLPMTDKMRSSILSGQKAFKRGGRVGYAAGGLVDGGGTNIDGTGGLQYDAMGNLTESQGGPVHAIPYDQDAVNSLASQLQDGTYGK